MNLNKYTEKAQEAILAAQQNAERAGHPEILPEHLLFALADQPDGIVPAILGKMNVDPAQIKTEVQALLAKLPQARGGAAPGLSARIRSVFTAAEDEAARLKDEFTSTEHLFVASASEGGRSLAAALLKRFGVTRDTVFQALTAIRGSQRVTDQNPEGKYQALERYGRDLTEVARRASRPGHWRDDDPPGIRCSRADEEQPGAHRRARRRKTAIVEGLAQRIIRGDIPEGLRNKRIVALDMGALVAARIRGSARRTAEGRLKKSPTRSQVVLFIDELHTVVGAGAAGDRSTRRTQKPMLARAAAHTSGRPRSTSTAHIEKDAALERRFQPVLVGGRVSKTRSASCAVCANATRSTTA
jgi:ATP-dependent Clp protease ATP-binding subunit ClpB